MNSIKMGLEYELQLMTETEKGLEVVWFPTQSYHEELLPKGIVADFGNIEIRTEPKSSYKEAVEDANNVLLNKLVPTLIEKFKLQKFALFLPTPMCPLYYNESPNGFVTIQHYDVSCLKHWNISLPFHRPEFTNSFGIDHIFEEVTLQSYYKEATKYLPKWKYNYKLLEQKGYPIQLKDCEHKHLSRVHIKIPYHYAPPQGNPDLMPNFEDTIIPSDKWKNLVGYYKNNCFVKVRDLV